MDISFYQHFVKSWIMKFITDPNAVIIFFISLWISIGVGLYNKYLGATLFAPLWLISDEWLLRGYPPEIGDIFGYNLHGHWVPTHEFLILIWELMILVIYLLKKYGEYLTRP